MIFLSFALDPSEVSSKEKTRKVCHSVIFNFTTLVRLTHGKTCADVCADAFNQFESVLKLTNTKYGQHARVGEEPPAGARVLADNCLAFKMFCFNKRHASEPLQRVFIEGQRVAFSRYCSATFDSCVGWLDPEPISLGCFCTQALGIFSVLKEQPTTNLYTHCALPLVCVRLASFVSAKTGDHGSKWWCEDDKYRIIEEQVKCSPDTSTMWCTHYNSPHCATRPRVSLECPSLLRFNETEFEAWQAKRKRLQDEAMTFLERYTTKRQRDGDLTKNSAETLIEPDFDLLFTGHKKKQSRTFVIGANNWPGNQYQGASDGRRSQYPPNLPDLHGASTSRSVGNQNPSAASKHIDHHSTFAPYKLDVELRPGPASGMPKKALILQLDDMPTIEVTRRRDSADDLYDYRMQQAIHLSLISSAEPSVDRTLRLGQPASDLQADRNEIDCDCERICGPETEPVGPSVEEADSLMPYSFL